MDVKLTVSSNIEEILLKAQHDIHKDILRTMSFRGQKTVNYIRDKDDNWEDQTGNLRSSIGAKVAYKGQEISNSGFSQIKEGSEGASKGAQFAMKLASEYSSPYTMIVVAGMEYAGYVEAKDNKDVLASAELMVRSELPKDLAKLEKKKYFKG